MLYFITLFLWGETSDFSMFFKVFIQILGFIGIGFNIIAVQFNSHGKIMFFKTVGELMFVIHYILLGAWAGVAMDSIGVIRNIVFTRNVKKNKSNKVWIAVFASLTIVLGVTTLITTWDDLITGVSWIIKDSLVIQTVFAVACSLLSIVAKFLTTVGYAIKNPNTMRKLNFPSSACWFIYNFLYFSLSGVINEIFVMTSIIIAQIRYNKPKKHDIEDN